MAKIDAHELVKRWTKYANQSWTQIYDGPKRERPSDEAQAKPDGFQALAIGTGSEKILTP